MNIINIKGNELYLREYCKLCSIEWGSRKTKDELNKYVNNKITRIKNEDKVILVLGLIDNNDLLGFISLFKYDGDNRKELTPWYATMYVKEKYRGLGYSKILNDKLLEEAGLLGYEKIYLKTDLDNYYEKFGAIFIETLENNEKLYYMKTGMKQ